VGVMTFSKPRIALGQRSKRSNVYELSRFSTDHQYKIYGLASKFLKYFNENYEWEEIYSYSDRRWSQGNLYESIGFTFDSCTPPSYWYIVDKGLQHRYNWRKNLLDKKLTNFDPNLTEWENMRLNGFDRIWDCGNKKYVLKNNV
jgi:hypothetical protein